MGDLPRSGDVLHITRAASVQFVRQMLFRVIRIHDWPTYDGWVWIDGYELNGAVDAVERRSIFVQIDGLRTVDVPQPGRARNTRPVERVTAAPPATRRNQPGSQARPATRIS